MVVDNVLALATALRPHDAGGGGAAAAAGIFGAIFGLIALVVCIVMIAAMWKVFDKAGKPGWYAIIPILNVIALLEIIGKPWYFLLCIFIPGVGGLILSVIIALGIAERFGQSTGFAVGLILVPVIFWPLLGFGSARYSAPTGVQGAYAGI